MNYKAWTDFEQNISQTGVQQTYFNLVKAGVVGTLTEGELEYRVENDKADIEICSNSFYFNCRQFVTVKKSDITSYIKANPNKYEVEASRDLVYVQFKEDSLFRR